MENNTYDFGFTFEDSESFSNTEPAPVIEPQFQETLLEKISRLESKLETLSAMSGTNDPSMIEQHKQLITSEVRGKLAQVEQLILPLLYNLQKNPEKEYIHWPNRTDIIQSQIDKIKQITHYYGENNG